MRRACATAMVAVLALASACSDEGPAARSPDGAASADGNQLDGDSTRSDSKVTQGDGATTPGDGPTSPADADGARPEPDGPPAPGPTKILAPKAGAALVEGSTVKLAGQGTGALTWSYDANSDGEGELTIGQGASVDFVVPTAIKPPRELTLLLSSSAGKVQQTHAITTTAPPPDSGAPADVGPAPDGGTPPAGCKGFVEAAGLVVMEVESAPLAGDWSKQTGNAGYTGSGYYEWKHGSTASGTDAAGGGILTYDVCVTTTGRYQLHIRSAAPDSTEHNDVWVRFPDTGAIRKQGTSADVSLGTGWFKVYENKSGDTWQWQTTTVDNNAHEIFVDVGSPQGFRVELSGRSTLFKVDRIVLRHAGVAKNDAIDTAQQESSKQ